MGATAIHPTDQTLRSYGLGKLDDAAAESVHKHLEGCAACRQRVAELTSDSFLDQMRDAHGQPGASGPVVSSLTGLSMLEDDGGIKGPPPTDTLPPGLADHPDYEIVRELGQGGMGTVYLALNRLMGRQEVLKVVSKHLMNRSGTMERFLGEIRNAALLHHTNIVTAYSAVRLGERIVFAMEYVEGLDLSKLVKAKGPLPVSNACNYVHQAALGLQHASDLGMVHRDIKPSNLMLAKQGNRAVIKVLDFGLAKVKSEGAVDGGLTHEGQLLGTPDYVAPEQISDARRADIRADIYSLGCTLYYLLTGGAPFHADNLYEILQAHHSMDALPLNLARPEVPLELAALVARMMAKEPRRRFQTPREVAQALSPFFKKGIAGAAGPSAEVSKPDGTDEVRARAGALSVPTTPAERTPSASAPPLETTSARPRAEPTWEDLIALKVTEPLEEPARALTDPGRPSPWIRPSVAVGLLLVGLIVAGAVIIRVKTADGVIVVENIPEHAVLEIDGEKITVTPNAGEPVEVEIRAGTHGVVVKHGDDVPLAESVTIEAGKKSTLRVRMEPRFAPASSREPTATIGRETGGPISDDTRKNEQTGKAVTPPTEVSGDPVLVRSEGEKHSDAGPPGPIALPEELPKVGGDSTRTGKNGSYREVGRPAGPQSPRRPIKNSIGMTLNPIPAGEFLMGSPDSDKDAALLEKPQHKVRISPFYLGVTEVTQEQYQAVMGNNPSHFSSTGDGKDKVAGRSTGQYPVERVSWVDAVRFCDALSKKEGLTPFYTNNDPDRARSNKGDGYRLPTEAEWEYACRAGTSTRYPFGDRPARLRTYGWVDSNAGGMTHPVREKLANDFGLYDMHGNVSEWCTDWFDSGYYMQAPPQDPLGPPVGSRRVIRGGTAHLRAPNQRSAVRFDDAPGVCRDFRGFRVARGQTDQ
jgi:formylglycine-generating enzyme required for sulfatase activity/serine/threonine protein kinase